jgi:hypothetical protein
MAKSVFSFTPSTVKSVISSFGKAAKLETSLLETRNKAGQQMVDDLIVACTVADKAKYFDSSKARAACIDVFTKAQLSESAIKNYPMSVKLAFVHGVPFTVSLFTKQGKESAGIATPSAGNADNGKSGTVSKTTEKDMHKTFSKFLAQARLLNKADLVADMIDTMLEHNAAFTETVLNK